MNRKDLKLALALSGGGIRAAVFHLGILKRLAQDDWLEQVTFLSTVSGGSLVTGLVYSIAGNKWPTSPDFLNECLPEARRYITTTHIAREGIARLLRRPPWFFLQNRANIIARTLEKSWGISGKVGDLGREPRWNICVTTYETGKNWRFIPQRMGDYLTQYAVPGDFALSRALAASAAYPGLIGPLKLKTREYEWFKFEGGEKVSYTQPRKTIHLWDGGIYDNLGVEPLFKGNQGYREEFNFLVVSDASKGIEEERSRWLYKPVFRLMDIATDQVRSLRARALVGHFQEHRNTGVYLKMGNTAQKILQDAELDKERIKEMTARVLCQGQVKKAGTFSTTLRQLTEDEFDLLVKHGWEVANYTLLSRCPAYFSHGAW